MQREVVITEKVSQEILQITMRDEVNKNTFSPELLQGLTQAFAQIRQESSCKVVILTGYGNYFCTGGTKEALLDIQAGRAKFTDMSINFALDCPVPVIAAMQGHALGGGFTMGLLADLIILSRESIYSANFMKYGFTPGVGATFMVPYKLGAALGYEMLFSAEEYQGGELKQRGVSFPIYPRNQVLIQAIELAKKLAEKPKVALTSLKQHLAEDITDTLSETIKKELLMHEKTFHSDEVKNNIESIF